MTRPAILILIAGLASMGLPPPVAAQPEPQAPAAAPAETPAQPPAGVQPSPPATPDRPPPTAAPDERNRYSFHRMGEGFVRLDSHTGHLAQCGWSATGWSCKMVPDERGALEAEMARLQRENAALKKSLLSSGFELPLGVRPEAKAPAAEHTGPTANAPDPAPTPKSQAEVDRAIAFVKDVWRRLVEMMVDLQRDVQRKS